MNIFKKIFLFKKINRLKKEVNLTKVLKSYKGIVFFVPDTYGLTGLAYMWIKAFREKERHKKIFLILPERFSDMVKITPGFDRILCYTDFNDLFKKLKAIKNEFKAYEIFVDFSEIPNKAVALETETQVRITWKENLTPYFNLFVKSDSPFENIMKLLSPKVKLSKNHIRISKKSIGEKIPFKKNFVLWDFPFSPPEGINVVEAETVKSMPVEALIKTLQSSKFYAGKGELMDYSIIVGVKIVTLQNGLPEFLFRYPLIKGVKDKETLVITVKRLFAES